MQAQIIYGRKTPILAVCLLVLSRFAGTQPITGSTTVNTEHGRNFNGYGKQYADFNAFKQNQLFNNNKVVNTKAIAATGKPAWYIQTVIRLYL